MQISRLFSTRGLTAIAPIAVMSAFVLQAIVIFAAAGGVAQAATAPVDPNKAPIAAVDRFSAPITDRTRGMPLAPTRSSCLDPTGPLSA